MNPTENVTNLVEGIKKKDIPSILSLVSLCLSLILAVLPFFSWVKFTASAMGMSQSESRSWFNGELKDMVKAIDKEFFGTMITIFLIVGMLASVAYIVLFFVKEKMPIVSLVASALFVLAVILSFVVIGDISSKLAGFMSFKVSLAFAGWLALILAIINGVIAALPIIQENQKNKTVQ